MKFLTLILSLFLVIEIDSQELRATERSTVSAEEMIRQWVQTEKLLGKEKADWLREKEHLSDLLGLYEKEMKLLSEELAEIASADQDDEKKVKLEKDIAGYDAERRKLRVYLLELKPRVQAVVKRFPEPLKQQISETTDALNAATSDKSARDILMPIISIVEAANSFNSGIFRTSQKVIVGGEDWQAEVMYLGLSRAYFSVGEKSGVGVPGANGWEWSQNDELTEQIKQAMSVYDKTTQPELIALPLKVK